MAKRFTDSEKWRKPWFRGLSVEAKLVWVYLTDNCDHAGIWPAALDLISSDVGIEVTDDKIKHWFGDKIVRLRDDKYFLPGFVDFQYGSLNPANRVHESVLNRLKKEGAYKGLKRPSDRAKDKDKDKDKDKFLGEYERIYAAYPRKIGKATGLKKLKGADPAEIWKALNNFLAHHKLAGTEPQFIPHFKTWTNNWRDCLEPDYGKAESFGQPPQMSQAEIEAAFAREPA